GVGARAHRQHEPRAAARRSVASAAAELHHLRPADLARKGRAQKHLPETSPRIGAKAEGGLAAAACRRGIPSPTAWFPRSAWKPNAATPRVANCLQPTAYSLTAPAPMEDWKTLSLVGGVLLLLTVATIVGQFLKRFPDAGLNAAAVRTFNLRLRAWWMMCALLATARFIGEGLSVAMFGFISFVALREFITI